MEFHLFHTNTKSHPVFYSHYRRSIIVRLYYYFVRRGELTCHTVVSFRLIFFRYRVRSEGAAPSIE